MNLPRVPHVFWEANQMIKAMSDKNSLKWLIIWCLTSFYSTLFMMTRESDLHGSCLRAIELNGAKLWGRRFSYNCHCLLFLCPITVCLHYPILCQQCRTIIGHKCVIISTNNYALMIRVKYIFNLSMQARERAKYVYIRLNNSIISYPKISCHVFKVT